MMQLARMRAYDDCGETLREKQVDVWRLKYIDDEEADGLAINLTDEGESCGVEIVITAEALAKCGYVLQQDLPDEDVLLEHGYVRLFNRTDEDAF